MTMNVQAMTRTSRLMLLGLVAGFAAASCVRETSFVNLDHCANQTGNDWCAERYGGEGEPRPYCVLGNGLCGTTPGQDGCVSDEPSDSECYSPCGDSQSASENSTCLGGMESTDGTMSTGETTDEPTSESSTTGPAPCMGNEDCPDAAAPLCEPVSGECVTCDAFGAEGDAACAELDPAMPLCVGGACVQCTAEAPEACTGMTPVCDDAKNTCVPCNAHDQCGEAACNLFTGECLPSDAVVHVGAGQMYTTIGAAVDSFDPMAEGTIIVHGGTYNDQPVTADGARVLAFLAADFGPMTTPPRWTRSGGGSPQLTVVDATVLMDGMQLSGNADDLGLVVNGGRAWVDRSRIVQNTGGGVLAEAGAELVLRNCFVGTALSNLDTTIISGATASLLYTTVIAGDGGLGESRGLLCQMNPTVSVRNSIIVSVDDVPEVECPTADISYSATEMMAPGMGNESLGNLQAGWFINETDDFRLDSPPAVIGTTARWVVGDPMTDIDGDPRPTVDGTADFAGADVP